MSAAGIINTLWESIDPKELSDEHLESMCRSSGQSFELLNLADVMEGLGCMISNDGNRGSNVAGNFQDSESVSQLLWVLADAVKTSASVCFVLSEARALRNQRREMVNQQGKRTRKEGKA